MAPSPAWRSSGFDHRHADLGQALQYLYNVILETCQLIFALPDVAQSRSSAIQTGQAIRFRIPVRGHWPYKVFWSRSEDGPLVEAIFPHPVAGAVLPLLSAIRRQEPQHGFEATLARVATVERPHDAGGAAGAGPLC